jgi:hypothetical protein
MIYKIAVRVAVSCYPGSLLAEGVIRVKVVEANYSRDSYIIKLSLSR